MSSLKDRRSSKIDEPDAVEPAARAALPAPLPEVTIGCIVGFKGTAPLVDYPANPAGAPLPAFATAPLPADTAGRTVALVFIEGDPARPLILGLVRGAESGTLDTEEASAPVAARLDGETVTLTAERELVLKCGRASITLTRAGKVLIRGAYLLSRSSGINRIKGGSVQIN
mgnify:CR=1 FL=1